MKLGLKTGAILLIFSTFSTASQISGPKKRDDCPDNVISSYFAGWHEGDFPASEVPWDRYNLVKYAFAGTTPDPAKLDESGLAGLPTFVSEACKHGVKTAISYGGWGGSGHFSTAVGSASNRTAFVKAVVDLAAKYKVDGIDIDWEYPNSLGIGCNERDASDTANFLLFLQQLRADPVGGTLSITVAAGASPWFGPEGVPVKDVSEFAKVVDHVMVMIYDMWGPWSPTVGPNAPLNDTCAPASDQMGSAVSSVQAWTLAGMPREKIVLGVPGYGHSFRVDKKDAFVPGSTTKLNISAPFNASAQPNGTKWDSRPGEIDVCGVKSTSYGGIVQYWGMIEEGYIDGEGTREPGQVYTFDDCSQTPFIYNPETEIMVSYDDPRSMRAKGRFIKDGNLKGFSLWEVGGDYRHRLVDAIRSKICSM